MFICRIGESTVSIECAYYMLSSCRIRTNIVRNLSIHLLTGEGVHLNGSCTVGGSISYVSQSPWIQNATLRENVLFGTPYDKERY